MKNVQKKNKRPVKKGQAELNKLARSALASGEVVKGVEDRKDSQNTRSLYMKFNEHFPANPNEIKELHSEIKYVRVPRMGAKKGTTPSIKYAFVEFENEEICIKAKNRLTTTQFKGKEIYVDFVGEKSKKKVSKDKVEYNPLRLFVSGLTAGVTKTNLKEMFPKSAGAEIPRTSKEKGTTYGFVQFSNPGDAKSAFDAAKGLTISGHPITVLFATRSAEKDKRKAVKQERRTEKRKAQKESTTKGEAKKLNLNRRLNLQSRQKKLIAKM